MITKNKKYVSNITALAKKYGEKTPDSLLHIGMVDGRYRMADGVLNEAPFRPDLLREGETVTVTKIDGNTVWFLTEFGDIAWMSKPEFELLIS